MVTSKQFFAKGIATSKCIGRNYLAWRVSANVFHCADFKFSLVSPGSAERQESTRFFVRNSSGKLPFSPGLVDGFETRPTETGLPEIRWQAFLVKYLSIPTLICQIGTSDQGLSRIILLVLSQPQDVLRKRQSFWNENSHFNRI